MNESPRRRMPIWKKHRVYQFRLVSLFILTTLTGCLIALHQLTEGAIWVVLFGLGFLIALVSPYLVLLWVCTAGPILKWMGDQRDL